MKLAYEKEIYWTLEKYLRVQSPDQLNLILIFIITKLKAVYSSEIKIAMVIL